MTLSPSGKIFQPSRATRVGNRVGLAAVVSIGLAMVAAGLLATFGPKDEAARYVLGGFGAMLTVIGAAGWVQQKKHDVQYALRADGIDVLEPDAAPQFVSWAQITGFQWKLWKGVFEILGAGDHVLARLNPRVAGIGELINVIVRQGVIPKRRAALPYSVEKSYSGIARAFFWLLAAVTSAIAVGVLLSDQNYVGFLFPGILFLIAGLERLFTQRRITVDRNGVVVETGVRAKSYPWATLEGGALVVIHGQKGSVSIAAAVKRVGGGWLVLRLPGADPIDLLAAIAAVDPAKIIAAPDRLLTTGRSAFSSEYREPKAIDNLLRYM